LCTPFFPGHLKKKIHYQGNITTNAMSYQSIETIQAELCKISREPQGSPNEPSRLEKDYQKGNTEGHDAEPKKDDDTVWISNDGKAEAGIENAAYPSAHDHLPPDTSKNLTINPDYVEKKTKHYDGQPKKDEDTVSISNTGKAAAGTDNRRSGSARDQADYDSTEDNYNKEFYEVEAKFRKECESKTYSDYSSSDSEWKPHGGWPDPSLSPRSESNRRNLEKDRREYKSRAWGIKEAAKRGSNLAKTEPNHPVAPLEEGIINASGVVEPFAAPK
jgi:hypothetical protein